MAPYCWTRGLFQSFAITVSEQITSFLTFRENILVGWSPKVGSKDWRPTLPVSRLRFPIPGLGGEWSRPLSPCLGLAPVSAMRWYRNRECWENLEWFFHCCDIQAHDHFQKLLIFTDCIHVTPEKKNDFCDYAKSPTAFLVRWDIPSYHFKFCHVCYANFWKKLKNGTISKHERVKQN